ncbi:MAG: VOC family protein [Alphaproteobacteria bacterium]|jgi:catechol 2,3-dioxygenase-like lactoylglutathione lyase family enzyme
MQRATGDPWMSADDYGRSLRGLGVNLLVRDMDAALPFHREVLDADVIHADPDFAVLRRGDAEWMLHADHTYQDHPLHGSLSEDLARGIGAEIRLYGRDPDAAEAVARKLDFTVLQGATDKPHGLREAFLIDADGYLWVPGVPIGGEP